MVRVLLTGFGPFPGVPDNPSGWLAETLGQSLQGEQHLTVHSAVLSTEWDRVVPDLSRLHRDLRPNLMVHFGVSPRSKILRLERGAHNRIDRRRDAKGHHPATSKVSESGHERLETNLPVSAVAASLRRQGHGARVSNSCGRYLCNLLYYRSLAWAHENGSEALFVHVPLTRAQGGLCDEGTLLRSSEAVLRLIFESVLGGPAVTADGPAATRSTEKQTRMAASCAART